MRPKTMLAGPAGSNVSQRNGVGHGFLELRARTNSSSRSSRHVLYRISGRETLCKVSFLTVADKCVGWAPDPQDGWGGPSGPFRPFRSRLGLCWLPL